MFPTLRRQFIARVAIAALVALGIPTVVSAHSELETATPADKATVESPFSGPIVLTFSAALADDSKADLVGSDGDTVASAEVDGPGATMTIALTEPLAPGDYEVKWVSVADDGDLLRGTLAFTVAAAAPTAPPTVTPIVPTSEAPTTAPSAVSPTASGPTPSPSSFLGENGTDTGSGDVILPIVVGLIVIGVGAAYLLGRRNRPTLRR